MNETVFNKTAHLYEKIIPQPIIDHYLEKRVKFIKELIKNGKTLDVGCGTGMLAERLEELQFDVTGIDFSLEMLNIMRKRCCGNVIQGNCVNMPFKSNTFDLTLSVATFHHIAKDFSVNDAVKEIARVTKHNGIILIWDHNPMNPYWKILLKRVPWDREIKLVWKNEILKYMHYNNINPLKVYYRGFIPDFLPKFALPVFKIIEFIIEHFPLLRVVTAHYVIVGVKK